MTSLSPIENNELEAKIRHIIITGEVPKTDMRVMDLSLDTVKKVDAIMSLIEQAVVEARIDELKHIDDPANVRLYFNGLISVADRIAQLQDNQGKDVS